MHVSFTTEENDFQKEVNSFFNEKYPADIKEKQNKSVPLEKEDFIRWQKILRSETDLECDGIGVIAKWKR